MALCCCDLHVVDAAVDGKTATYPAEFASSNDLCHSIYVDCVDLIMSDEAA